ncbi:hypothetical protein KO489_08300 [Reinekea forsetii]|nr:hypothetical protein [Reinekea forsetii]
MSKISRYLQFIISLLLVGIFVGAFIILFQSAITIDVIDRSLERHVEQYLLERSTQDIVMREITTLYGWLVLTSSALAAAVGWLVYRGWRDRRIRAKKS